MTLTQFSPNLDLPGDVIVRQNYTGHKKGHVFGLPNDEDLRKRWIRFINREDITESSNLDYAFVCEDHFDKNFIKPGA